MKYETEAKFKVENFNAIRRKLCALGAKYQSTAIQTDSYFDTPKRVLLNGKKGIRIRNIRYVRTSGGPADKRPLLTYKGPRINNSRLKIRPEMETRIDDADAVIQVLKACGLKEVLRIQKRRASYKLGRCLVELDELPVIGNFVEIEAADEKAINRAIRKLDIEGKPITDHYIALLSKACKLIGKGCVEVTFDRVGKIGNF